MAGHAFRSLKRLFAFRVESEADIGQQLLRQRNATANWQGLVGQIVFADRDANVRRDVRRVHLLFAFPTKPS